jgi:single-strand DNA-binding protein
MNKAILIGRCGTVPEIKYLSGENVVANFSMATSKKKKSADGSRYEETAWHKIVLWGNLAKLTEQYVKKGDLISIIGEIAYRSYDAKDGTKKYITEIQANELEFLGKSKEGGEKKEPEQKASDSYSLPPSENISGDEDSDLPF